MLVCLGGTGAQGSDDGGGGGGGGGRQMAFFLCHHNKLDPVFTRTQDRFARTEPNGTWQSSVIRGTRNVPSARTAGHGLGEGFPFHEDGIVSVTPRRYRFW